MKNVHVKFVAALSFMLLLLPSIVSNAQPLAWARQMGNVYNNDHSEGLSVDAQGNVYTIGYFIDSIDMDPGPGTYMLHAPAANSMFIQKLDAAGELVWAKQVGNGFIILPHSITIDKYGDLLITGYSIDVVDFDPGPGTFTIDGSTGSVFIQKLDAGGNFIWAKNIGAPLYEAHGKAVITDSNANVFVTGFFTDTADFDPGPSVYELASKGEQDIFVVKLDVDGNFIWARSTGGTEFDQASSISVDMAGNAYIVGFFDDTVDFDPGPGVYDMVPFINIPATSDVFLQKLDVDGNFIWAKQFGGMDMDFLYDVHVDAASDILLAGGFQATADFDPGIGVVNLTSAGNTDGFILKLDSAANFIWVKQLEGVGMCLPLSIATDAANNIVVGGVFYGSGDFDPGIASYALISNGVSDMFIQELNVNGNFISAISLGSVADDIISGISFGPAGEIYATGQFMETVDFSPGTTISNLSSPMMKDVFVAKFKENEASVQNIQTRETIDIFPNPNNGSFKVKGIISTDHSVVKIKLIDMMGRILSEGNLPVNNGSIDAGIEMENLVPAGTYILQLTTEDTIVNIPFMKR